MKRSIGLGMASVALALLSACSNRCEEAATRLLDDCKLTFAVVGSGFCPGKSGTPDAEQLQSHAVTLSAAACDDRGLDSEVLDCILVTDCAEVDRCFQSSGVPGGECAGDCMVAGMTCGAACQEASFYDACYDCATECSAEYEACLNACR